MKLKLLFLFVNMMLVYASAFSQTHLKIIIMAGQSNMVGNGGNTLLPANLQATQTNVKIYCNGTFDNSVLNQWLNVMPGMGSWVQGKSPSPAFGSEVSFAKGISGDYPNDNFAIIKCAYSGTEMATRWRPPSSGGTVGDLYSNLISTVNTAINNLGPGYTYEIAGMCWMQGESDAMNNNYANEYQSNLTNFIKDVRSAFQVPNMPFVLAKIGTSTTEMPFNAIVRQAQTNVAVAGSYMGIFDTQAYPTGGLHYYSDGYISLGYDFANALKPLLIKPTVPQTPYTGTAYPIPGLIEAENFDKGGEGVSYHDNEVANLGGAYRTTEGVDIQACSTGGYDIGWTVAGEWQEYSVNVLATGTYKVGVNLSGGTPTPGSIHMEFDGVNTSGTINGVATGDWQTWTTVNDTFNLTAGTHIMRVYFEKPDVNLNSFTFTNLSSIGTGDGLTGNYFNGMNFETPVFNRKDAVIQFDWNTGSPDASVNVDQFSIRWTGQIQAKYSDTYTFYVNSDNGRRLWVNGQLIIDKWIPDYGVEYTGTINLKAGVKYDIRLEYFEKDGGANCKLEWSSPTQAREVVATSQLYANKLPIVSLTTPVNNAIYTTPASVTITANASDTDGTIANVEFYNGATLLGSDATAPFTYSWANVSIGSYIIIARAYDNENAVTTSASITIQVNAPANQPPVVTLTAPLNNAIYIAPASIIISANASDTDGTISKVEFYNGTTLLGTDAATPFTYSWTNVTVGSYTITAKAYDNVNAVTTSSSISIQVNAPANQFPVVTLTAPTNNPTYTAQASVSLTANASDADGSISKVEFYNGSTLLGTDAATPFTYSWTNVIAGSYTITAKAYDNVNAVTTSNAVVVTVDANVTTSLTNVPNTLGLVTAPIPFQSNTKITINDSEKIHSVVIYNTCGLEVERLTDIDSNDLILGENLADGMYLVQLVTSAGITTIKVIKENK
jgi:hypothetical protein